jgi:hypothetical protein
MLWDNLGKLRIIPDRSQRSFSQNRYELASI